MKIYKVNVNSGFIGLERWLIQAEDIQSAADKARKKIKRNPSSMKDWRIISIEEMGDLTT